MRQLILLFQCLGYSYEATVTYIGPDDVSISGVVCLRFSSGTIEQSSVIDADVFPEIYREALRKAKDHLFINLLTKPVKFGVAI